MRIDQHMTARRALPTELDIEPSIAEAAYQAARQARRGYLEDSNLIDFPVAARRMLQEAQAPVAAVSAPFVAVALTTRVARTSAVPRRRGWFGVAGPLGVVAAVAVGAIGFAAPALSAAYTPTSSSNDVAAVMENRGQSVSRSRAGQVVAGGTWSTTEVTVPAVPGTQLDLATSLSAESTIFLADTSITEQANTESAAQEALAAAASVPPAAAAAGPETEASTTKAPTRTKTATPSAKASGRYLRPVSGPVTSSYGYRIHPILRYRKFHDGMDLSASCGTPVKAANSGVVEFRGYQGNYGYRVELDHGATITSYSHMSRIAVKHGQTVAKGQVVGYVGSTGRSTGCHLHFSAERNGNFINPSSLF